MRKADEAALGCGGGGGQPELARVGGGRGLTVFLCSYAHAHPAARPFHSVRLRRETPVSTQKPPHDADVSFICNSPNLGTTETSSSRRRGQSPLCPHHGQHRKYHGVKRRTGCRRMQLQGRTRRIILGDRSPRKAARVVRCRSHGLQNANCSADDTARLFAGEGAGGGREREEQPSQRSGGHRVMNVHIF